MEDAARRRDRYRARTLRQSAEDLDRSDRKIWRPGSVEVLPNGHYKINNYHGGVVFPNPEEPHKGFKILANVFFAHAPAIFGAGPG